MYTGKKTRPRQTFYAPLSVTTRFVIPKKQKRQLTKLVEESWFKNSNNPKDEIDTKAVEKAIEELSEWCPDIETAENVLRTLTYEQFLVAKKEYKSPNEKVYIPPSEAEEEGQSISAIDAIKLRTRMPILEEEIGPSAPPAPQNVIKELARKIVSYASTVLDNNGKNRYPDFAEMEEEELEIYIKQVLSVSYKLDIGSLEDKVVYNDRILAAALKPGASRIKDLNNINTDLGLFIGTLTNQVWSDYINKPGLGGTSSWATKSTKNAAKKHADSADFIKKFGSSKHTIHHKVSQAQLKVLADAMNSAGVAAQPLVSAIATIGGDLRMTSPLKILLNMPANLEVGVAAEQQSNPLGRLFDGTRNRSRAYTTRSHDLSLVDSLITIGSLPKGTYDWVKIAKLITQAHQNHMNAVANSGNILSKPVLNQWQPTGNQNAKNEPTYQRN